MNHICMSRQCTLDFLLLTSSHRKPKQFLQKRIRENPTSSRLETVKSKRSIVALHRTIEKSVQSVQRFSPGGAPVGCKRLMRSFNANSRELPTGSMLSQLLSLNRDSKRFCSLKKQFDVFNPLSISKR